MTWTDFGAQTSVTLGQLEADLLLLRDENVIWGGTAGGSANAITLTVTPTLTAYNAGQRFAFIVANLNTSTTVTISVSGLAAVGILSVGIGKLIPGNIVHVSHDGTNFQIVNTLVRADNPRQDVTSAATTDLTVGNGNLSDYIRLVLGVSPIGNFTIQTGREVDVVLGGSITLNASGNLILPGGNNIAGVVNDTFRLRGEATNVARVLYYTKASGSPLLQANTYRLVTTSGLTATFTNGVSGVVIPANCNQIIVNFEGVSTNGSSVPIIQIGSGSFVTTGYLGAASTVGATAVTSANTSGFLIAANWAAANLASGSLTLTLSDTTSNTWVESGTLGLENAADTLPGAGRVALSGALDRIRVLALNGTDAFDAGAVSIVVKTP